MFTCLVPSLEDIKISLSRQSHMPVPKTIPKSYILIYKFCGLTEEKIRIVEGNQDQ